MQHVHFLVMTVYVLRLYPRIRRNKNWRKTKLINIHEP
jgi:hypothetical protein